MLVLLVLCFVPTFGVFPFREPRYVPCQSCMILLLPLAAGPPSHVCQCIDDPEVDKGIKSHSTRTPLAVPCKRLALAYCASV